MSYTEWLRDLSALPKTAEFCLMDVEERVSVGSRVLNFLITEAKGQDVDDSRRRGQTKEVCRPRIYVYCGTHRLESIEICEPLQTVDKKCINTYDFSLHEFYMMQSRLCESVLASLTTKIGVISERSGALLESQLGDEIVKLVTAKLQGVDVGLDSLKSLLISQIKSRMPKDVIQPVNRIIRRDNKVQRLSVRENPDLIWDYTARDSNGMILKVTWKGIVLGWDGSSASISGTPEAVCARDTFLFIANLPSFGQMIATRLAKIME